MRSLQRNQQTIYYRLYSDSVTPITETDEWGNTLDTGQSAVGYGDPVEMKANVSPATGSAQIAQFGTLENYDKVIVTAWTDCPIREDSVLYIDTVPVKTNGEWSKHDYIVTRVAKSLNGISIAVRKVDVS